MYSKILQTSKQGYCTVTMYTVQVAKYKGEALQ